jgi:hypothetical protein
MEGNASSTLVAFLLLLNLEDSTQTAEVDYLLDGGERIRKSYPLQPWTSTPININVEFDGRPANFRTVVRFRNGVGAAAKIMRPLSERFWDAEAAMLSPVITYCTN